jgi:hypothetical protein
MRNYAILAVTLLLGISAGVAQADYMILVAKVGGAPPGAPGSSPGSGCCPMGTDTSTVPMPYDPMSAEGMYSPDGSGVPMKTKPKFITLVVETGLSLTPRMANDFKEAKRAISIPNPWRGATSVLSPKILETHPSLTAVAHLHVGADRKLFPSVAKRLADKKNGLLRDGDQATAEKYLDAADWALRFGLLDD